MSLDLSGDLEFLGEVLEGAGDPGRNPTHESDPKIARRGQGRGRFNDEVEAVRAQFGSLESMRQKLGLSRRQIANELMVDPSAWTRWTQGGQDTAPPHVYKMLSLLLAKKDSKREASTSNWSTDAESEIPQSFVENGGNLAASTIASELEAQIEILRRESAEMKAQLEQREILGFGWKIMTLIAIGLALISLM